MNWPCRLTCSWLLLVGVLALLPAAQLHGQVGPQQKLVENRDPARATPPSLATAGELKCAVVEWKADQPKPALTVACPPEDVFAPLRLYLGLSWEQAEERDPRAAMVVALPKTPVRVRFTPAEAQVRLKVLGPDGKKPREAWIPFGEITRIGFATEP